MLVHATSLAHYNEIVIDADASSVVVVKFGASWCPPCRRIAPAFEQFAQEENVKCVSVDIDKEELGAIAAQSGVSKIPTFAVFRAGVLEELKTTADIAEVRALVHRAIKKGVVAKGNARAGAGPAGAQAPPPPGQQPRERDPSTADRQS